MDVDEVVVDIVVEVVVVGGVVEVVVDEVVVGAVVDVDVDEDVVGAVVDVDEVVVEAKEIGASPTPKTLLRVATTRHVSPVVQSTFVASEET